jgi:hypothetical protein
MRLTHSANPGQPNRVRPRWIDYSQPNNSFDMNHLNAGMPGVAFGAVLAALAAVGCANETTPAGGGRPPGTVSLGPEESFAEILATFRRGIETGAEGVPAGGINRQGGGYSVMSINNTVSHKLLPPSSEGEPYRATITVVSQSRYSIQRTSPDSDDADRDDGSKESEGSGDPTRPLDTGVEVYDDELITSTGGSGGSRRQTPTTPDAVPLRRQGEFTQTYDLVYRNGRWELVTQINPDTERAVLNAFKRALSMQY